MRFSRFAAAALLAAALTTFPATSLAQADAAAALRASGMAGEQADGYLGVPPGASVDAATRARIDQINIRRRAYYTELAAKRGVTVNDVGAATACELFQTKVDQGQWYRSEAGQWIRRGAEPIAMPSYCG